MSIERLQNELSYCPITGLFKWEVTKNRVVKGQVAGSLNQGYVRIKSQGRNFEAHRLAWLFTHGYLPKCEIDHINGIRNDNRICNLREATFAQNSQNCVVRRSNKYGLRGVAKQTCSNRYASTIRVNGKSLHLGTFKTPEEAHQTYLKAVLKHHGNFAYLNQKENHMSRASSVVLTPAEKKAVVANLKAELKVAQGNVKLLASEAKTVAKARAAEDKVQAGLVKTAESALAKAQKALDAATA